MNINETHCTINFQGKEFTARGAYLDDKYASVYIVRNGEHGFKATDWHGNIISLNVQVVSEWAVYHAHLGRCTYRSVRFSTAPGVTYSGRYNSDWSELVNCKRIKTKK